MQQYLTIWDVVLTPIYLIILIFIAKRWRNKHYTKGNPLRKYYLPGLYAKFGGTVFIALIYQFYYGGGDTYFFFTQSKIINSALDKSFIIWIKLLLRTPVDSDPQLYAYVTELYYYNDPASHTTSVISAILGLFNGTTYLPIAFLFAYLSYTGIWAMYKTFTDIYPNLTKQLALPFLFIPSTIVWGSSIFKDTICLFGLGWMVYCTFRLFINRDFTVKNLLLMTLSFYLVAVIKIYILLAFLPALGLWLLMIHSKKIRIVTLRWMVNLSFVALIIIAFIFFSKTFAKELNQYSLEKIAITAENTRAWLHYVSKDEGSAYDLGKIDGSLAGMLSKFPAGVTVTLFRPFFWEAKKPIVLFSALEAALFLIATLFVISKVGLLTLFRRIAADPNLSFFVVFSLIFAFAVGISSYNFGSLSRYKIPCLPFYGAFLTVLYFKEKRKKLAPTLSKKQFRVLTNT